jgi:hypothetical protein
MQDFREVHIGGKESISNQQSAIADRRQWFELILRLSAEA